MDKICPKNRPKKISRIGKSKNLLLNKEIKKMKKIQKIDLIWTLKVSRIVKGIAMGALLCWYKKFVFCNNQEENAFMSI